MQMTRIEKIKKSLRMEYNSDKKENTRQLDMIKEQQE